MIDVKAVRDDGRRSRVSRRRRSSCLSAAGARAASRSRRADLEAAERLRRRKEIRTILAAALPLLALAGCGPSDAEIRNEIREGALNSCLAADRTKAPPGFDWRRFCTCVTDRVVAERSGRELKQHPPSEAERREVVALCRAELGGAAAPAR